MAELNPEREQAIQRFLATAGWADADRRHLTGDASHRRYERLVRSDGARALLMDAPHDRNDSEIPGTGGRTYSQIAHLAQDCRPFVAVANHLKACALSAPQIFAHDIPAGLILLEDFGDRVYGDVLDGQAVLSGNQKPAPASGEALDEALDEALYGTAIDVIADLHQRPSPADLPLPDGSAYRVPLFDQGALAIEVSLLVDWYSPALLGQDLPPGEIAAFREIWAALFEIPLADDRFLVLRDMHSPNLLWLEDRQGPQRVGLIDFQDAVRGPRTYDLVSVLQDARRDVPAALEARLRARYLTAHHEIDGQAFAASYAIMGAQRASKIIGIFARLKARDNKPGYLKHLPRVWTYLERNLAHPVLSDYRAWIDRNFPPATRLGPFEEAAGAAR